jgi:hypothetical protein
MRALFILCVGVALGACGHDALPGPGGSGGAGGDMAAVDLATPGGGGPHVCSGSCAACNGGNGVCCGNACCPSGEWCDSATLTCRCGERDGCKNGQFCASGGPVGQPGTCGIVCCGAGVPCPL